MVIGFIRECWGQCGAGAGGAGAVASAGGGVVLPTRQGAIHKSLFG